MEPNELKELEKFLETFLPDYESLRKQREVITRREAKAGLISPDEVKYRFNDIVAQDLLFFNFKAIIQNYTDQICERQRELCARIVDEWIDVHETEPFENGIYVVGDDMTEAEQPQIEDLLTKK